MGLAAWGGVGDPESWPATATFHSWGRVLGAAWGGLVVYLDCSVGLTSWGCYGWLLGVLGTGQLGVGLGSLGWGWGPWNAVGHGFLLGVR